MALSTKRCDFLACNKYVKFDHEREKFTKLIWGHRTCLGQSRWCKGVKFHFHKARPWERDSQNRVPSKPKRPKLSPLPYLIQHHDIVTHQSERSFDWTINPGVHANQLNHVEQLHKQESTRKALPYVSADPHWPNRQRLSRPPR